MTTATRGTEMRGTDLRELEGQVVVIEFRMSLDHPFGLHLALVQGGRISLVGGGVPGHPAMVGRVRSQPVRFGSVRHARHFRAGGMDYDAIVEQATCTLADGSVLYRVNDDGDHYWISPDAPGNDKRVDLCAHVAAKTPATEGLVD